jgi:hypothetical protein
MGNIFCLVSSILMMPTLAEVNGGKAGWGGAENKMPLVATLEMSDEHR